MLNTWKLVLDVKFRLPFLISSLLIFSLAVYFFFFFCVSVTVVPRPGRHRKPMTAPKTQKDKASKRKRVLLAVLTVVVILGILATAAFFSELQFLKAVTSSKDIRTHHLASCFHHRGRSLGKCAKFRTGLSATHFLSAQLDKMLLWPVYCPSTSMCHSFSLQSSSWLTANISSASVRWSSSQ